MPSAAGPSSTEPARDEPADDEETEDGEERAERLRKLRERMLEDLCTLDFAAAEERWRDAGGGSAEPPPELSDLAAEIAAARSAWSALEAALADALRHKTSFELPRGSVLVHADPSEVLVETLAQPRSVVISAIAGPWITLSEPRGTLAA